MNQVDLWSGGHQHNRCENYCKKVDTDDTKFIACVCRHTEFKKETKHTRLLLEAIQRENVCYPTDVEKIILKFCSPPQ